MNNAVVPTAEVGAPCLARFGAVDPHCLGALALTETLTAIDAGEKAAHAMEAARPAVEAGLHRLVGALEDTRLRRAALDMRRDAHNARRCRVARQVLEDLTSRMDAADAEALAAWCDASGARAAALERAEAHLKPEIVRATDALMRELAIPELRCGIAMASPDFHDELARARRMTPGGKTARTALSYLSRSAVKTSPFSTLTTIGWARLGTPTPGIDGWLLRPGAQRTRRVRASLPLAVELLVACARDEELAEALEFEVNPTIRTAAGVRCALIGTRLAVNGFAWRREEIVDLAALGHLTDLLRRVARGRRECFWAALGGDDPQAAFVRMIDLDILRPVLPWSTEKDPLEGLADALAALSSHRADRLVRDLRELATALAALADAPAAHRAGAQRAALRTARNWLREMGRPVGHWVDEAGVGCYEDVFEEGRIELGEHVRDDLARVAADLWPLVVRSRLYDELVAAFLDRHGPGGRCADVLAFLIDFLAADEGRSRVDRALRSDLLAVGGYAGRGDGVALAGAHATAPPSAMVRFQIAAATHADVLAGRYRLVVNQCSQGPGGLLARFAGNSDSRSAATAGAELRAWTASLAPDADVVHVGFASDWSGLQAVPPNVAAELPWPGNLLAARTKSRGVRLSDLDLRHEPAGGGLALRGPDGRRVVPIYLGTVPPYLVGGPARLLMALGDPWILRAGRAPEGEHRVPPGVVIAEERRVNGRVVLSRRRWRFDSRSLPVWKTGEPDVAFLRRAYRWRCEHDIPVEVFATARRAQLSFDARLRKPRWLRFDSLHALRAAEALLGAGVTAVDLAEALPTRDEHWVRAADGSPRAAEFVALLRWPSTQLENAA